MSLAKVKVAEKKYIKGFKLLLALDLLCSVSFEKEIVDYDWLQTI